MTSPGPLSVPDAPDLLNGRSHNGVVIPPSLQENLDRHCAHLAQLTETLGRAGVDEAMIAHSVSNIMASYEAELLHNLMTLHRGASHA